MKHVDIRRVFKITQKLSLHLLTNHLANDSSTLTDLCVVTIPSSAILSQFRAYPNKKYSKHALTHLHSVEPFLRWWIYCTVYSDYVVFQPVEVWRLLVTL